MTNGKAKGAAFERRIANILSERLALRTGIPSSCRRNQDSGAYWGASDRTRLQTHDTEKACFGDIVCPSAFRSTVEAKFYAAAPTLNAILRQRWPQLDAWIAQAEADARSADRRMMLVVKFNHVDEIVVLRETIPGLVPAIIYRNWFIVSLADFLALPDRELMYRSKRTARITALVHHPDRLAA